MGSSYHNMKGQTGLHLQCEGMKSYKGFCQSQNEETAFKCPTMTGDGPTGTWMMKKNLLQKRCQQWEQLDNIHKGTIPPFPILVQQMHSSQEC